MVGRNKEVHQMVNWQANRHNNGDSRRNLGRQHANFVASCHASRITTSRVTFTGPRPHRSRLCSLVAPSGPNVCVCTVTGLGFTGSASAACRHKVLVRRILSNSATLVTSPTIYRWPDDVNAHLVSEYMLASTSWWLKLAYHFREI